MSREHFSLSPAQQQLWQFTGNIVSTSHQDQSSDHDDRNNTVNDEMNAYHGLNIAAEHQHMLPTVPSSNKFE